MRQRWIDGWSNVAEAMCTLFMASALYGQGFPE